MEKEKKETAKKTKRKKISYLDTQAKKITAISVCLVLIILLSNTNSAYPGSMLYILDRGLESMAQKLTFGEEAKINLEVKLARERLYELKDTPKNTAHTIRLVNDYKTNLDRIAQQFTIIVQSEEYSNEEKAKILKQLVDTEVADFSRSLNVRSQETSIESVKSEIKKAVKHTSSFIEKIFEKAIHNIDEGTSFDNFAINMLSVKSREVSTNIGYMGEDTAVLLPQLSDEQIQTLSDLVNSIREEYFLVRDDIRARPNADVYDDLEKVQGRIDDEFSPMIVKMSQESAGITNE